MTADQFGDDELRALAADMVATMYAADGVGLAACQIGVDLAVFVFDCLDESGERYVGVVCNPTVPCPRTAAASSTTVTRAACRSPARSVRARARRSRPSTGFGLDGEPVRFEGDGLLARCLQHETDHTLGNVFGDRVSARARKKLQKLHDAAACDYPPDWPT